MLNLFITYDDTSWKKSPAFIDKDRCLTEYILPELKEQYSNLSMEAIEEIKKLPCLFAYEKSHKLDAYIGFIKNIDSYQKGIKIDYELTGQIIAFDNLMQITELLDMATWEWNRTHWTIKKTNFEELEPYFKEKIVIN